MKRVLMKALCLKEVKAWNGITVFHEFQLVKCFNYNAKRDERISSIARERVKRFIAVVIRDEDFKKLIQKWDEEGSRGRDDGTWVMGVGQGGHDDFNEHFILLGDIECRSTNTAAKPASTSSNT